MLIFCYTMCTFKKQRELFEFCVLTENENVLQVSFQHTQFTFNLGARQNTRSKIEKRCAPKELTWFVLDWSLHRCHKFRNRNALLSSCLVLLIAVFKTRATIF